MTQLLRVPFFSDESLPSFLSRTARANGRSTLRSFLADLGLSPKLVASGHEDELRRVADTISVPAEELLARRFVIISRLSLEYRGVRHLRNPGFRVCPACIAEDSRVEARMPGTRKYARTAWSFKYVSCCAFHRRRLVQLPSIFDGGCPDFSQTLDNGREFLERHSDESATITRLERFYADRADDRAHPGGLADLLSLPNAARLSGWLGVAAVYGREHPVAQLDEEQLRQARDVGFSALQEGEDAVRALLDRISKPKPVGVIAGGNGFYGRLYREVQKAEPQPQFEWFRELLRDHATTNKRIAGRARVFGLVETGGWTSVKAISDEVGLHHQTVQRYLTEHFGYERAPSREALVRAEDAERLLSSLRGTVGLPEVSELLGWPEVDCRRLASIGILVPAATIRGPGGTERHRYDPHAVVEIRATLRRFTSSDADDLVSVGRLTNVDQDRLLKAAFSADLKRFAHLESATISKSLLVSRTEAVSRFSLLQGIDGALVRDRLALDPKALAALLDKAILKLASQSAGGRYVVTEDSVSDFEQKYVTLGLLRRETGIHQSTLLARMELIGIKAAYPVSELRATVLRREDAARLTDPGITHACWRSRLSRK
jgi:hypothetical protein